MQPLDTARRHSTLQHSSSGRIGHLEPQSNPSAKTSKSSERSMVATDPRHCLGFNGFYWCHSWSASSRDSCSKHLSSRWGFICHPWLERHWGRSHPRDVPTQHAPALELKSAMHKVYAYTSPSGTAPWIKGQGMASKGCSSIPVKKQGNVWGCVPSPQRRRTGNYY